MSKKTAPKPAPAEPAEKAKPAIKSFGTVRMKRTELNEAAYNPRDIDDYAFKKLCDSVRKFGLVDPPIWNRRTGTLVGGHQRLKAADKVFGSQAYEVDVVVIDVPLKREKQINVVLNHDGAQGTWNLKGLAELFNEDGMSPEDFMFDTMEVALTFEGSDFETMFSPEAQAPEVGPAMDTIGEMAQAGKAASDAREGREPAEAYAGAPLPPDEEAPHGRMENGEAIRDPEAHAKLIAERDKMREKMAAQNETRDPAFYLTVVCRDRAHRAAICEALGEHPDTQMMDASKLSHRCGLGVE